ncbi:hypothetical protein SK128_004948, partial [Halocaridina rubra]
EEGAGSTPGALQMSGVFLSLTHAMIDIKPSTVATELIANFKLPTFSTIDAHIWFRRAEIQFRLKRITNSGTQADHVSSSIPDTLFPQISDWLESQGDNAIAYQDLKTFLLKKFSPSPEKR